MPSPHPRRPAPRPLLALLPAALAGAGYDKIATSGGTTGPGQEAEATSSVNSGGYAPPGTGPGGASCGEAVTASFVWVPAGAGDEPPSAVVVEKTASANASGGAPAAADGLGDKPFTLGMTLFSAGSAYEVKGGESFEVTVEPSASASGPKGGACGVSVIVSCTPLRITLSGVKDQEKDRTLMIGAKLVATLIVDGLGTAGPNNTFAWSVSGGKPFADYDTTKATNQYTGWSSPNAASTTIYYAKPDEPSTITCTATLKQFSPPLSVTATTKVTAQKPDWSASPGAFSAWHLFQPYPTVYDVNDATEPTDFDFYTKPNAAGCVISGQSETPLKYRGGTPQKYDWGVQAWAQKVTANSVTVTASPPVNVPNSGKIGLDGSFPYPTLSRDADGSNLRFNDSPGFSEIGSTWSAMSYTITFEAYFYYKPPGNDSRYVPLRKYTWSVDGRASRTGKTTWSVTKNSNSAPGNPVDYPDHMTWSDVVNSETP